MKEIFKKYAFIAVIILSLIDIALLVYFYNQHPLFRTAEYKIKMFLFNYGLYVILFWSCYCPFKLYKYIKFEAKNIGQSFLRILGYALFVLSIFLPVIVAGVLIINTLLSTTQDKCMEKCVSDDLSDYNECLHSTCS